MRRPADVNPRTVAEEAVRYRVPQSRRVVKGMVGLSMVAGLYAGTQDTYGATVELLEPTVVAGSILAAASERALMYRSLNKTVSRYAGSLGVSGAASNGELRPKVMLTELGVKISDEEIEEDPEITKTDAMVDTSRAMMATIATYSTLGVGVALATGEARNYDHSTPYLLGATLFFGYVALRSVADTESNAKKAEINALGRIENISEIAALRSV